MAIREVLKMGDPRLLAVAEPVRDLGDPALENLLADMRDTMQDLNGAGLAAPQIGVGLRVVIFGMDFNPRYPEAAPIPYTVLINPQLTPVGITATVVPPSPPPVNPAPPSGSADRNDSTSNVTT